ncbi:ATP-binding protein [Lysinibacillus piscis]|uniref:histidine kinase n=1 Tax=Lysinibacillus piscis TaxID=2518931 RepID=A0ABQ5NG38_9BACI|nr:ATP-binding protein [Lysinibacillus sp. KH24]GLC87224.1 hypothetical protein LYSBPC_03510 [Lysinibacillus sp. KH24]
MPKSTAFLKRSIRGRFFQMLFWLTATFFICVIAFYLYVDQQNKHLQTQREHLTEKLEIVAGMQEHFIGISFRSRGYYAFQNKQELALLYKELRSFEELLEQFSRLKLSEEEQKLYSELVQFLENYQTAILPKTVSYVENNDYESLRKISNSGTNDLFNEFVAYTKEYQEKTETERTQLFNDTITQGQMFTMLAVLLSVLILIAVSLMMRKVLKNLIQPIEQLTSVTNDFTVGQPFEIRNLVVREDEFSTLASSFYKMVQSIQEKEEVLTTQNEELVAQQDELQDKQIQLQDSLDQLEKYNALNHVLTFTLEKQDLADTLHRYLGDLYTFDINIFYWLESDIYAAKGVSPQSAKKIIENLDIDKRTRLIEEKIFIITREVQPDEYHIAKQRYYCYDLYAAVLNKEGDLVAVMMATREGYPFTQDDTRSLAGILNRVSIAFERILMYEAVEKARQLNQNIIDNVSEGIQLVNKTGDVILINEALCQLAHYENNAIEQPLRQDDWLQHLQQLCDEPQVLHEFFETAVMEAFQGSRKLRYSIVGEMPIFIEMYATSIYEGNEKVGTMFVHRDITKEYEIDQMKSELVSTVSHELRTPLSSVLGFTELLLTKNLHQDRQQKYIETIHKEALRLTNLINDFLDLQRMESGKQQYNMHTLSINEMVFELVNRHRHEKKHTVHVIDKAQDVQVRGDEERLVQVFINLIGNAIKFSPNGGDVIITLENKENMLQVSIQDEGIGIPSQEIAQLFRKFKRIDNSARRTIGGTGLGLAICQEIITRHRGQIWLESEEGKGTTVHFTLPLENHVEKISEQANEQSLNVILVEDDWSLALLLSEEFKSKGLNVIHHYDLQRAYEDACTIPLVGIVIDLMLTDSTEDGWWLIEQLKTSEQTRHIPIIISSALDEAKDKVAHYGIAKYFTKPYSPEELSSVLLTFLEDV